MGKLNLSKIFVFLRKILFEIKDDRGTKHQWYLLV